MEYQVQKIVGLDTLRFLAFCSVFLFHNFTSFKFGYLGIDLFFVLSAFLLTKLALDEFTLKGSFSQFNFFIRRALRIYPLYFAILFGCFFIVQLFEAVFSSNITLPDNKFCFYFFASNFDQGDYLYPLKFLWSIAIEEQFYLLFIFLSLFFKKFFHIATALLFVVFLVYASIAAGFKWHTYFNTLNYLADFYVGMQLAKHINYLQNLSNKLMAMLFMLMLSIAIVFQQDKILVYFFKIPVAFMFAIIIAMAIKWFLKFQLTHYRVFVLTEYLGRMTYGLYIFSGFIMLFVSEVIKVENKIYNVLIQLLLLIPIALLSFHFFERFFLKFKNNFR